MANNQLPQKQLPPSRTTGRSQNSSQPTSTTQKSSRVKEARLDRLQKNHGSKIPVNPVILLFQQHTLIIWSMLWVAMLAAGGLAILGLTNPGHVETVESSPENTTIQETVLQQQEQEKPNEGMPAWIYGAIAIGCATGGWVAFKQLKGSRKRRFLRKNLKQRPTSTRSVPPQRQKAAVPTRKQAPNPSRIGKSSAPKTVPSSEMKIAVGQNQIPNSEESQNKLADSMDLRKRQPLSSLLRNQ